MGIIVLPLLLAILYFIVPGLRLGRDGIAESNVQSSAFAKLIGLTAVFHAIEFGLPFVLAWGDKISQIEIMFQIMALAAISALIGGTYFKKKFKKTGAAKDGVLGAAFYLSAGLVPVSWFTITEDLAGLLSIKWTY